MISHRATGLGRILVVDDERTLRLMLNRAMQKEGYQVSEASDGEKCLAFCERHLPDMILLDAILPGMDGFTCCSVLQQTFGKQCPPILMITSLNDEESVDKAFAAGATDYVTKPIHWAVLRQRVRRILQASWAMAELHQKVEHERILIDQLEVANRELHRLARIDSLTELANRRCFDEYLQQEWKRLMREQGHLSLILLDVDFFKSYNDSYGHQAGDDCLREVASLIKQAIHRPADLAARYGGEEFAIILPNTDLEGAVYVAEQIQTDVKAAAIPHCGSGISDTITLSCGLACAIPEVQMAMQSLISSADTALYQAKLAGRNRISCYLPDKLPA
jgi:diguanylate cyclase (GGDEF)-like protein